MSDMGHALQARLRQKTFESPSHEATLNLMVATGHLRQKLESVLERHGLTGGQYNVLRILRGVHPAGHPRCEIASRMIERAPDVTRLIDRLERAGLVKRDRSAAADRRRSIATISRRGLLLLRALDAELTAVNNLVSERLSLQECLQLSRLCEKIYGP